MIKPFSKAATHYILFSIIIGFSFYLGIVLYSSYGTGAYNSVSYVQLKQFGPKIEESSRKDLHIWADKEENLIKSSEIKKWVEPYVRNYSGEQDLRVSYAKVVSYLDSIASKFETEAVNAKLIFKDGRAEVFVPHTPGRKLNLAQSAAVISSAITEGNASVSLAFDNLEPEVTLDKINNLGITSLIGKGTSDYGKSSAARISNIKVGLNKFNGVILGPGEEFSFNKILGEVDDVNGYQAELVIKNGELVREFGGGLCQVATTFFRAAIMSGFPITERKPHSFPVHYYNPQGFDATIYPGVVDLRFKNDTQNHVLIQSKLSGSKLTVEVYGSDDGRKVAMEGPVQYDQKDNGAMKAYFTRTISYADGMPEKKERFDSRYNPPPASPLERNPLE
jgi:vancomycin resistance protein YoaR